MLKDTAYHQNGSALQRLHFGMGLLLGNSDLVFQDLFAPVLPKRRSISSVVLWKGWRLIPIMDLGFIICLFPLQDILAGSVCLYKMITFARFLISDLILLFGSRGCCEAAEALQRGIDH